MIPYIGITDFTTANQVRAMLGVLNAHQVIDNPRMLHVGVMMSYKTLHGIRSKWSAIFPAKETIANILAVPEAYNCLHYADYDGIDVAASLQQAIGFGGPHLHAVQLDMIWPNPLQILEALNRWPDKHLEVILQINKQAFALVDHDVRKLIAKLATYDGLVDRVLLDTSMGRGHLMDASGLLPHARAIRQAFPTMGIGAAGGLGPTTMDNVQPLVAEFPDLSVDAQGRLRPSGDSADPVDWGLAEDYLIAACQLFSVQK